MILHFSTHSVVSKHQFHHVSGVKSLDDHGVFVERDTRLIDAVKRQVKAHGAVIGQPPEVVFCDLYKSDGGESIIDFCNRYEAGVVIVCKSSKSYFGSSGGNIGSFVMKNSPCAVIALNEPSDTPSSPAK
jgi:nucleotide-binding universal stress UspA family protein